MTYYHVGMDILEVRKIIADALRGCKSFDKVMPLGRCVHVYVDDKEYEVVLRTVRTNDSRPITKIEDDTVH